MDLPSPWDEGNIVASVKASHHRPCFFLFLPPHLPPGLFRFLEEVRLEFYSLLRGKVVAGGDEVGAMGVGEGVQVTEEGEHFCGVAARAESDEETGGRAAAEWRWRAGREGGEGGEEADLVGNNG